MRVKVTQLQTERADNEVKPMTGNLGSLPNIGERVFITGDYHFLHTSAVTEILEATSTHTIFKTKTNSIYRLDHEGQFSGAV
jgi:hypothetical protein